VDVQSCTLLEEHNLALTKKWPKGTPVAVVFDISGEGILSVHSHVDKDQIDFKLTITGVKSEEELSQSKATIGRATVS
jgi:hypothetical protein